MIDPSHPVSHYIHQIESGDTPRSCKPQMPDWLQVLIWNCTEHFDPLGSIARAGYIATQEEDRWIVRLFLGETEVVGGPFDGAVVPTAFVLDLEAIRREFERIDRIEWLGLPSGSRPEQSRDEATISVEGLVHERNVRLLINLRAPEGLGPGLKRHSDGSYLPASIRR